MCGIHLIWGKGANQESIESLVKGSLHRGPDQQATLSPWPGLWIGVNRLKILHPGPDADQPFWAPDGKSLIIWNGEIYNFRALKSLLQKMGVDFFTESDTEVLLHWLKIFGANGLEKINGMFALIYVDLSAQTVLVARDPNGEKPLYYHQDQDTLIISSETRGIGNLLNSEADWGQLESYYYLRTPIPGKTFFKGVKEWKASRYSLIRQHSAFRWDSIISKAEPEPSPSKTRFQEILRQVIDQQFHADVPVGMLLSGGADSSLLYAYWYRSTGTSLPTFTIAHEQKLVKKYSDSSAIARLQRDFPSENHSVFIDQKLFWDNWESYLISLDLPVGDSASFLTWMIAKEAKHSVKVLISGAGADELWGGYQRHTAFRLYEERKKLFMAVQPLLQALPLGRIWSKFFSGLDENPQKTFLNFSALESIDSDLYMDYERIFDKQLMDYKQVLDFDRKVYLVQDVLKIQDNALMAHGLEGRSPYLDAAMVNLWKQVPDESQLQNKLWIRESLVDLGLDWVAQRKKLGFGLPLLEWFSERGEFSKRVFAELKELKQSHAEHLPKPALAILDQPEKHISTHFLTFYNLFLISQWLKIHQL
ncbi:asparagine synthase (glutamine-hydrolyzing) [Algoriphagus vanfongensis]|uniref:asparagine synthase (glutamine-hydrolyzing) n=1 Tax=Algoriphagus vanfongensis TaxID=426371 RepID=UPI0003F764F6|nr:asparagine synthase (glutamine-hydrolyzing) [Algoriphagus vanfongensis]